MSPTQAFFGLIIASALLLYISSRIKKSWSGDGYSDSRFRRAFAFMVFAGCIHANHAYTGQIFLTDVIDKSPLKALSFILMFIHAYTLPTQSKKPPGLTEINAQIK